MVKLACMLLAAALQAQSKPELIGVTLTGSVPPDLFWKSGDGEQRCRLDARSHHDGVLRPLRPGDRIEAWIWSTAADHCEVLSIRILPSPALAGDRPRVRWNPIPINSLIQRGDLHYSGYISKVEPERLHVVTRKQGLLVFRLRHDTYTFDGGAKVPATEMPLNHRVYVRAGFNWEGILEAFRVSSVDIVKPDETVRPPAPSPWGKP